MKRNAFEGRLLGAHMSIAGGVDSAIGRGERVGCTAIQIFTKNNNQWNAKPLSGEEIGAFKEAQQKTKVVASLAHCAYLINLASPDKGNWERSFNGMKNEVLRAGELEIPYLVLHPGSHTGSGATEGIKRISDAINRIHEEQAHRLPMILLECMAGQGSSIGSKFEELRDIMADIKDQSRIGICIDTCHMFAAGYDIRTRETYDASFQEFDRIVGLEWIKAFHLNDSKKDLACHVDRHEHIGKGFIGLEAFRCLLNDPRFSKLPMVLETPKNEDDSWDLMNLDALESLFTRSEKVRS